MLGKRSHVSLESETNKKQKLNDEFSEQISEDSLPLRRIGSIFYKVSKSGFPDNFLFGTCHIPVHNIPGLSNFHPEESEGFKKAKQFFVESTKNFANAEVYGIHRAMNLLSLYLS